MPVLAIAALVSTLISPDHALHPRALPDRAVFDTDNRQDYYELSTSGAEDALARRTVDATAAMIYQENLSFDAQANRFRLKGPSARERFGLCEDVRFAEQPAAGLCSGFLVAPDIVLTAGHCAQWEHDCRNNAWVFGYVMTSQSEARLEFEPRDVYRCKQTLWVEYDHDQKRDFAVVLLDRAVEGREPLELRRGEGVRPGDAVALAGYPGGLPAKWVGTGRVTGVKHPNTFLASVDAFGGNSGSPLIDPQSGLVEGILIAGAGHQDFVRDPKLGCNRPRVYPVTQGRGIEIQRIQVLEGSITF